MNTEEAAAAVGGPRRGEEKPSQVSSNSSRSSKAPVLSQSSNSLEEFFVDAEVRNRSFKEFGPPDQTDGVSCGSALQL